MILEVKIVYSANAVVYCWCCCCFKLNVMTKNPKVFSARFILLVALLEP